MTSTQPFAMDGVEESPPVGERRKSVLFCPDCGHESDVHGDWRTEAAGGQERLRCPVCETVVETR